MLTTIIRSPGNHEPHNVNAIHTNNNNNYFISPLLLSMESVNTTYSSYIRPGMGEITTTFIKPWKHTVVSIGDTGANINAISQSMAYQLYNKYIQKETRPFRVRTGGGYITCQDYILFTITCQGTVIHNNKFYVITDLPFDYLMGRPLLSSLGYDLAQIHPPASTPYYHPRTNLDELDDEDIPDHPYPVRPKTNLSTPTTLPKTLRIANRDQKLTNYIRSALTNHSEICAKGEFDIGQIPNSEFKIEFKTNAHIEPIRCNEYPHNIKDVDEIERQLRLMIQMGLISRSDSEWRFPTFIVPKKNGEARIVFDYRKLNAITKRLAYSLPSIQHLMGKFKNKSWISTIDIKSGYWHIPIRKADRCKTAFIFNGKVYEWNVMPFGPTNAPPHFQKTMDKIFDDLEYVMVYMDDITVMSSSPEEHQQHLQTVFNRLARYKIKIRPDKCAFAQDSVEYLGFIVDGKGIRIKPKYKDKIQNIPIPRTLNQLRRFVGMVQYLHQFIPNLQQQLKHFHKMTEKGQKFEWNIDLEQSFQSIKHQIMNTELIYHPDPNRPFSVFCDASQNGIGAVLLQVHDGKLRPVSFCSKLFNKTQRNWHVSEQEIYAVIHAIEKWRPYLIGNHFTVYTDHQNLEELFNRAKNFRAGKLYRWAVRLQDFEFTAKYKPAKYNKMADYLSRDALLSQHTTQPINQTTLTQHKLNQPIPILQLYISHLSLSTKTHYESNNHVLYVMDPDEVVSDSDEDEDISDLPSEMPSPNTTPEPPIIPSNSPQNVTNQKPQHQYNTRYAKQQRINLQHQQNLEKSLITIPDPAPSIPYDQPIPSPSMSPTHKTNQTIISHKESYPSYNKNILTSLSL